ncbi:MULTISPECIES: MSMEG_0567/Sll0786 family nitrogen starvation N-acetyltransferase [unclassified Roseofilum]|uniref:MSMEG_0567/Sll0786 family nitrogen starvation N-acetyltransferase n=1 Tax=unclassified Roseofilum TaxID=2620099 RepID=UPI001B099301|nr:MULTISPECIES: MSMEG_0567/Sll0786 family nitrogen starvation N-acetyltransferase [unclassified Roseofilum]MBP0007858.1 GNAT family N-acetyltransferase [Roseofilum sp. Belize Diploria]MBP0014407.1 GNAT family N-acetyltransferase [Roseofilum sp. SID3]MBP0026518.1 GNAT family N-acetyltransferase [Roseofilum sp. SID2]MBP0033214.1 GNAT family N-acetyltransferase [Roseofilum sp. Belize BBD 4]MBP0036220.1 GNAT family N-acetyltransferase [Roseofilum sp. SID1]
MRHSYRFELAQTATEVREYYGLRYEIFCQEQDLFRWSDRDDIDDIAYPIVALTAPQSIYQPDIAAWERVVGVVRIYESQPGVWYGGRLGVHRQHRRGWRIGKGLIEKAVQTAQTWGCSKFLATVQLQNVRFFQRLHWDSLQELRICDRPHHLMQANLAYYPPNGELRPQGIPQWLEVA